MGTVRIASIPGDGIGVEVMASARTVLEVLTKDHGVDLEIDQFDWSCQRYLDVGSMMPADGIDRLRGYDAVLLGAVGWPGVADHLSLWGLLIPIRRAFDQYVNYRPVRTLAGVPSPLASADEHPVDLVIVRENTEGEYSDVGGRVNPGLADEFALQQTVFSRKGVSRIADYAFELSGRRRGRVTSATKSNGIVHTMPFWDQVVRERAALHPDVALTEEHVDALAAKLVSRPESFDVIVGSNLFGDILSDLAAAVAGSLGIAPSASLDPTRRHPSMFEPVHGSAPDIAGLGVANPVAMLWSVVLMLEHLQLPQPAAALMGAIETSLLDPATRTRDVGGRASTDEVTGAVLDLLTRP